MNKQSLVRIISAKTTIDLEDNINKMLQQSPQMVIQSISMSITDPYLYAAVVLECEV